MDDLPDLHREASALFGGIDNWMREALAHAMIDLGLIASLECAAPRCLCESREFDRSAPATYPSFDHVVPQRKKGPHAPSNLRLVHRRCNSSWGKGIKWEGFTESQLAAIALRRGRPQTPESNAKRSAALKGKTKTMAHREATRAAMANVERVPCPRGCGTKTIKGGPMARHLGRKVPCVPPVHDRPILIQ